MSLAKSDSSKIQEISSYLLYAIAAVVLALFAIILGFPQAIVTGILFAGSIFSFHELMASHVGNILSELFEMNNLEKSGLYMGSTILLDLLIAVPMFGLGRLATRYIVIFVLMFGIVILYWKFGNILRKQMRELYESIENQKSALILYSISLPLSILYLYYNSVSVSDIIYPGVLVQQVGSPLLGLISALVVMGTLLVVSLIMLLAILYFSPIIISVSFPILLLLDAELFWGEEMASISTLMELWIVVSWIVCFGIIFCSKAISAGYLKNLKIGDLSLTSSQS